MFRINRSHVGLIGGRSFDEFGANDWIESRDFFVTEIPAVVGGVAGGGLWVKMPGMRIGRNNHGCGVIHSVDKGVEIVVAGTTI